ncbi:uncharacterized protein LOC132701751 [Cylas formicarius]|uniref:uncharacterized protein LOC132701751 n=1 Tax=Cylas formicarius TaxID=197179 RepID=UPI002958D157|nr:uncharacterized protein LOC132701751 [Cylas formicarius]
MSDLSSDEEVCFGPYTITEAKRDARSCKGRKIDRRHSFPFDLTIGEKNYCDQCSEKDQLTTDFRKPQSDFSSFFTPLERSGSGIDLESIKQTLVENSMICDNEDSLSLIRLEDNNGEVDQYPVSFRSENSDNEIMNIKADALSRIREETEDFTNINCSVTTSEGSALDYDLNDTLDEINRFLEENKMHTEEGEPVSTSRLFHSADKMSISSIPKKVIKSTGRPITHFESRLPKSSSNLFLKSTPKQPIFKIPVTSNSKLLTPSKSSHKQYANILSPVGIYIRNTPAHNDNVKVKPSQLTNITSLPPSSSKIHKENVPNKMQIIPPALFKPAKEQIEGSTKGVKLPSIVKKLIPVDPTLITHQKKYNVSDTELKSKLELDVDQTLLNRSVNNESVYFKVQKYL